MKFPGRGDLQPGPVEEKDNQSEVEFVSKFRIQPRTKKPQYEVKWKGWGRQHNEWIDKENIDQSLIKEFWMKGMNVKSRSQKKPPKNARKRVTWQKRPAEVEQERSRVVGTQNDITTGTGTAELLFPALFNCNNDAL